MASLLYLSFMHLQSCSVNKALLQMKQANGFTNMGLFMNNDWLFQLQKNYKVGIGIVVLVLGIEY